MSQARSQGMSRAMPTGMPRAALAGARCGLVALVLAGASCGRYVSLTVSGVTPDIATLQVELTLDGRPLRGPDERPARHTRGAACGAGQDCFVLQLPDGASGRLRLDVTGLSAAEQALGWGGADYAVDQAVGSLGLALDRYALRLRTAGSGQGTVTLADLPACAGEAACYRVEAGRTVTPAATAAEGSYLVGWRGGCTGPTCSVTVMAPGSAEAVFDGQICAGRFCWENPLPQGNTLSGVWVSSGADGLASGDVIAVGDAGTILRYDAKAGGWRRWESNTGVNLRAVFARGGQVFVAGAGGVVVECSAAGLCAVTATGVTTELRGLSGNASLLVAVGDVSNGSAVVLRRRGQGAWERVTTTMTSGLRAVWAAPTGGEAYAVGDQIAHLSNLDQDLASVGPEGNYGALRAVVGVGTEVWAAGEGRVLRRGQAAWDRVHDLGADVTLTGLHGVGDTLWAVGSRLAQGEVGYLARVPTVGQAVPEVLAPGPVLRAVWGGGAADVWAVGDGGVLLHRTQAWQVVSSGPRGPLLAVADDGQATWAVGEVALRRARAGGWREVAGSRQAQAMRAVAVEAGQAWIVGPSGQGLRCTDADQMCTGGAGELSQQFGAVRLAAGQVFAAGTDTGNGFIARREGAAWVTEPLLMPLGDLRALAGPAAGLVVVGRNTAARRLADGKWQSVSTDRDLFGAAWDAATGYLAVGAGGAIVGGDGLSWMPETSPVAQDLRAVSARAGEAWAVGAGGALLRRQGGTWAVVPSGVARALNGVVATADGVYVVGEGGAILRGR